MKNNLDIVFSADEILLFFHRRKYIIGLIILLFALLAFFHTKNTDKLYKSSTDILIQIQQTQVVDIQAVSPQTTSDLNALRSQVELIISRFMLKQVVKDLNLIQDPEFNGRLRTPGTIKTFKQKVRNVFSDAPPAPPVDIEVQQQVEIESAISALKGKLDVDLLAGSYIIQIAATTKDPVKSKNVANTLAENYLSFLGSSKLNDTKEANKWLEERLEVLRKEVEESEAAVEEYKSKNNLLSTSGEDLTEQQVLEINQKVVQLESELSEKRARLNTAQRALDSGLRNAESLGDVLSSPVITSLRRQQANIAQEKAELLTRYGSEHPNMIKVLEEEQDVLQQIKQEVGRIVSSLRNEVNVSQQKLASLKSSMINIKQELSQNRESRPKLKQLEEQASSSRRIFQVFLERFKETDLQTGLVKANGEIISPAIERYSPVSPNLKLNLALAIIMGAVFGTILASILEFFSRGIKNPAMMRQHVGIENLNCIPQVKNFNKNMVNLLADKNSDYYQSIKETEYYIHTWAGDKKKVLAIASSIPAEGKTSVALALSMLKKTGNRKVLLIDCDYRKRSATRRLQLAKEDGLLDALNQFHGTNDIEKLDINSYIRQVNPFENFYFLPAGNDKSEHISMWELLESGSFDKIIDNLKNDYDLIILDTAPLLAVREMQNMLNCCDGALVVARWKKTPITAVQHTVDILREKNVKILGSVLNLTQENDMKLYDRGSREFYKTKYKYY